MFSIFTHVMKPVSDTNSEPELHVIVLLYFLHIFTLMQ